MSLERLIGFIPATNRTEILGEETERILRYTFCESDTDAVEPSVAISAIASAKGAELVQKKKWREILVEFFPKDYLKSLGFDTSDINTAYDEAAKLYGRNQERFVQDNLIEEKYIYEVPHDSRENFEYALPEYGKCNGTMAYPHTYQFDLKQRLSLHFRNKRDSNILVTMPTGAGKTVLAMEFVVDLFRSHFHESGKSLNIGWFVDRKELCEQSLQSFLKIWKQKGDRPVRANRYFDKFDEIDYSESDSITFGTFSLINARIDSSEILEFLRTIDVLIIDEAHAAGAFTYERVLAKHRMLRPDSSRIGLTATPFRMDDSEFRTLKDMFQTYFQLQDGNQIVNSPIEFLQKNKYLASVDHHILNAERGESSAEYFKSLHNAVKSECENLIGTNRNTIIFAQSRSHAIALNIFLRTNGVENELIIGDTPSVLRQEYLTRFGNSNDSLSVLVNHQILSTGIDVPGMNSIMILSNIETPSLALQILGRAMRGPKNGGNEVNTVYLTKDNYNTLKNFKILESLVLTR